MRKSPSGTVTSNLILSAMVGQNPDQFVQVLDLWVKPGSIVADVTYGLGVFWKKVPPERYVLHKSDIQTGTDCRNLPYGGGSIDAVILDPPYMEGLSRRAGIQLAGRGTHQKFRESYGGQVKTEGPRYHAGVVDLYDEAGREATRVLRDRGILIVKCQDEVSANRQHLTHVEIIERYRKYGLDVVDLFVLVRQGRPCVSRLLRQHHARKNHSYFLVFQKGRAK